MERCSSCGGQILTPVCSLCLVDKTESWLEAHKVALVREYRERARVFLSKVGRSYGAVCRQCRAKSERALCSLCYAEFVTNWLAGKDSKLAIAYDQAMNSARVIAKDHLLA